MPKFVIVALAIFGVLVSGCAGLGGTFSVDQFLYKSISGDTLEACAARSLQAWARHEAWVNVNYRSAAALAARAESAPLAPRAASSCGGDAQIRQFIDIGRTQSAKACACGGAAVELERLSCAGPAEDKEALKRRVDAAVGLCEGR